MWPLGRRPAWFAPKPAFRVLGLVLLSEGRFGALPAYLNNRMKAEMSRSGKPTKAGADTSLKQKRGMGVVQQQVLAKPDLKESEGWETIQMDLHEGDPHVRKVMGKFAREVEAWVKTQIGSGSSAKQHVAAARPRISAKPKPRKN